jgi:Outer membrane protein beta-barrel domain
MVFRKLLGVLVLCLAVSSYGQTIPQGKVGGIPVTLGAGFSYFDSDWNRSPLGKGGWIGGYTLWADYTFYNAPGALAGIGVEILGRDLNFARSGSDPKLRQTTGQGGIIYKFRHWAHVQPYGKLMAGYGGMSFTSTLPDYSHDTRTVVAEALGVDFIPGSNLIIRADYENQNWANFMDFHSLTPRGFTISVGYDFKRHPQ